MPNLRFIFDNKVETANVSSITASPAAVGTLPTTNMLNEYKYQVCRVNATAVTYTVTFTSDQSIGGVALPATNLSGAATIRVLLKNSGGTTVWDSGVKTACPGLDLGLWNWNQMLNANAFAYGGVSKTAVWCTSSGRSVNTANVRSIDIIIANQTVATYIDCSRIVAGPAWEPTYNVSRDGLINTYTDTSSTFRNGAGDLLSERGVLHDKLEFEFALLNEVDRNMLMNILRRVGTARNFFCSIFPEDAYTANNMTEQDYMIYGKRANGSINYRAHQLYGSKMEMEGW